MKDGKTDKEHAKLNLSTREASCRCWTCWECWWLPGTPAGTLWGCCRAEAGRGCWPWGQPWAPRPRRPPPPSPSPSSPSPSERRRFSGGGVRESIVDGMRGSETKTVCLFVAFLTACSLLTLIKTKSLIVHILYYMLEGDGKNLSSNQATDRCHLNQQNLIFIYICHYILYHSILLLLLLLSYNHYRGHPYIS